MVVRKRRKKNKLRGNRYHGHGNTKNRRGSGVRGGRGRAGSQKHTFSKYYTTFGIKKRLKKKSITRKQKMVAGAITLEELQRRIPEMVEKKLVEKKDGAIIVDGRRAGFSKILSKGVVEHKIVLQNCKASKNAVEKILEKQGKIEQRKKPAGAGSAESEKQ